MDLDFRKDQLMIKKTAREFLDKECPRSPYVREVEESEIGITSDLWKKIAKLGWLGMLIPEEYGGMECDVVDMTILMEEMGRACLPGPVLHTVLGALAILWEGTNKQKERFLSKIAAGKMIVTTTLNGATSGLEAENVHTTGEMATEDVVINGVEMFVPDVNIADYVLCPIRKTNGTDAEKEITLVLIDPKTEGVTFRPLNDTIAKDKLFRLELNNVKAPKENVLGKVDDAWKTVKKMIAYGSVFECARMTGGSKRVLDLSVNYAKNRKQYGAPIGSFQIIQHYLAMMFTDTEANDLMTYQAASMLSHGEECQKEISMAKAWVNDAYYRTCVTGHQIYGGVGFTEEFDIGLYFRRAKAQEISFGDTDYHNKRVANAIGLGFLDD